MRREGPSPTHTAWLETNSAAGGSWCWAVATNVWHERRPHV